MNFGIVSRPGIRLHLFEHEIGRVVSRSNVGYEVVFKFVKPGVRMIFDETTVFYGFVAEYVRAEPEAHRTVSVVESAFSKSLRRCVPVCCVARLIGYAAAIKVNIARCETPVGGLCERAVTYRFFIKRFAAYGATGVYRLFDDGMRRTV